MQSFIIDLNKACNTEKPTMPLICTDEIYIYSCGLYNVTERQYLSKTNNYLIFLYICCYK